jgi:hypothetical protein
MTLSEHDGKTTLTISGAPINATEEERQTFDDGHKSLAAGVHRRPGPARRLPGEGLNFSGRLLSASQRNHERQ